MAQPRNQANVYWGEYLSLLEGSWNGSPTLKELRAAPLEPLQSDVPNIENKGDWLWLVLNMPPGELREKWLEVATSSIDSLVVISTCSDVESTRFTAYGGGTRWSSDGGIPRGIRSLSGSNYPVFSVTEDCDNPTVY
ncbi:MAG: hypothetical protein P8H88_00655, partial [Flavobacteriales bacterium]|nr:hypothetical protein [Flavobacteriales bacterium]